MNEKYFENSHTFDRKRSEVWKTLAGYFQKFMPKDAVVLDLGAGYCDFINNIDAKEKHALDMFSGIEKYANKDVKTHVQQATNMKGVKSGHFDVVFASNFFEHLTRSECSKTLSEVKRILKEGGTLLILQPNFKYAYRNYFDDCTHTTIYTEVSMCDTLKNSGFAIKRCFPKLLPYSMKSGLKSFSFMLNLYLSSPIKPFAGQMFIVAVKIV